MVRFSATVSLPSRLGLWKTTPILRRSSCGRNAQVVTQDARVAGLYRHQGREQAEQGALAAAVGAEKAEDFAARDREFDRSERLAIAVTEVEAADLDRGLGGHPRRARRAARLLLVQHPCIEGSAEKSSAFDYSVTGHR